MVLRYRITLDDLIALQRESLANSKMHTKRKKSGTTIFPLFVFLFPLVMLGRFPLMIEALLAFAIACSVSLSFSPFYDWFTMFHVKRLYKKAKPVHLGDYEVVITDSGIERTTDNFHDRYSWDEFERVGEDEHHFFLYVSELFAVILKKEPSNLSVAEREEYQRYIREKVNWMNQGGTSQL
ncbi:YcxB family protein [Sediminibacillus sp. JSM 1682029]|uniref:YcxB family protein n=1 Tax=Sediminibacillus sp. JSM 1682029 TaxID=3229857 RepID=UPI0035247E05